LPGVGVLASVDLDVHTPIGEVPVEVPHRARAVAAPMLQFRQRQADATAEPEELRLGQRMGAGGSVPDRLGDQRAAAGARHPVQHLHHVRFTDQPLLEARNDDGAGLVVIGRPLRRVDQRPRRHRARWAAHPMDVGGVDRRRAVYDHPGRWTAHGQSRRNENVQAARPVTDSREAAEPHRFERRQATEQGDATGPGRQHRHPAPLPTTDRPEWVT
jgi:hypothetical protein